MKRYNMNLTCKGLFNRMNKNEIDFDCAVQRGLVWDNEKKSLLIHSILYGYSIPAFYMTKNEDGTYDSLDGKQRSNAIYGYMSGEYALSESFPIVYDEEGNTENFSGLMWENLPEWAQDRIKDYSLTVYYFEDMKEEEIREFFRRLNNGKPLSAVELTRVQATSIADFQTIAKHNAIASSVTEKGKTRFTDEQYAMQVYAMAYMDNLDFGTKAFRPYIQSVIVTPEQKTRIINALDYVYNCMSWLTERAENEESKESAKVLKKIKSRTHFVAMAYYAMLCIDANRTQDEYNNKVFEFFNTGTSKATVSAIYNETIGAGSAKGEAVQRRKDVIDSMI